MWLNQTDHFLCNVYWKVSWAHFFFAVLNKIMHMKVCGAEPRTYRASASCVTLRWILAAQQHCQTAVVIIRTTKKVSVGSEINTRTGIPIQLQLSNPCSFYFSLFIQTLTLPRVPGSLCRKDKISPSIYKRTWVKPSIVVRIAIGLLILVPTPICL